jgi:hypothetical protein
VDEDELVVLGNLGQNNSETLDQGGQKRLAAIDGYDDGKVHGGNFTAKPARKARKA